MKIFVDTADLDEIKELASWGIIDGVTTNPTLVKRSGRSFNEIITEIFKIVDGPISLEVVSEKAEGMVKEAKNLVSKIPQKYRKNIAIKIPMTSEGLKAVKKLVLFFEFPNFKLSYPHWNYLYLIAIIYIMSFCKLAWYSQHQTTPNYSGFPC